MPASAAGSSGSSLPCVSAQRNSSSNTGFKASAAGVISYSTRGGTLAAEYLAECVARQAVHEHHGLGQLEAREVLAQAQASVPVDVSGIEESEKTIDADGYNLVLNIVRPAGAEGVLALALS